MKLQKKLQKKWFCLFLAVVMLLVSAPVKADEILGDISTEEMGAEFAHDRILVVLTHEASLNFKSYTAADFSEIACTNVTNLTADIGDMVQQKINQTQTAAQTATFEETASNFMKDLDVDAYQQILSVELSNPGLASVFSAINLLSKRDDVYAAEPDYYMYEYGTTSVPNDPYYNNQQAYMNLINMPEAWDLATSSRVVKVGVIDSGIDAMHPDLDSKVEVDLCRSYTLGYAVEGGYVDLNGHGTKVASIIAAEGNSTGICGVGKNANIKLVSLQAIEDDGGILASRSILAINYAATLEIPIINYSLAFYWSANEDIPIKYDNPSGLRSAINNYPGLFVCGAGNENKNMDSNNFSCYPSEYTLNNIIVVGGCTYDGTVTSGSNYGTTSVDLFAPGAGIYTCTPGGGYTYATGTSYAAPFVAGVAALIKAQYPSLTVAQIKARILDNVHETSDMYNYCASGGYLDAFAALMPTG